ncbi:MAG: peptidase U32 family protein [Saccharofermentanales bacterium]
MAQNNGMSLPSGNKVELLSPAGNFEKLKMAVLYGADAVYMSGKHFGLRAFSDNFEEDELKSGIDYAHQHGVKAYVAMNILAHPDDFDGMEEYIGYLVFCGADALIISDPGIFALVRRIAPEMDIHISTQASVTNAQGCKFWHDAGARRIVLARELTLEEIIGIRREIPESLELEVFVHGAMCVSYSGRCLLSNYFTGRDGNRGKCAQPCRWNYELTEAKHKDQPVEMQQDGKGTYLFSSKDLCMIEHIPELINAGIHSFKIEGRIKGAFYAATVTKAYREAIDEYYRDPGEYKTDPALLADLEKTVHRKFDTGFYFGGPMVNDHINDSESYIKEAAVVGIIKSYDPQTKRAVIEQRNKIFDGELLEIVSPRGRHCNMIARDLKDVDDQPLESTPHPKMIYSMPVRVPVDPDSFIRRLGARD